MKKKFRLTLQEKRWVQILLFVCAVPVVFIERVLGWRYGWGPLFIPFCMILASLILPRVWLRCPRCRGSLLKRAGKIKGWPVYRMQDICPNCGMCVNWWKRY